MSKIEETLGLRSLEEALRDQRGPESVEAEEEDDYDPFTLPAEFDRALVMQVNTATKEAIAASLLSGKDTDERLNELYDSLMEKAETMARLAMELDPGKAPRAFEVMNQIYKNAMDAVTSKRDHELKTLRHMLDQQKFEHEKNADAGAAVGATDAVVAVMTTADMVRNFRKALDEAPPAEPRTSPSE